MLAFSCFALALLLGCATVTLANERTIMDDLENATIDDLLEWANGLNVCMFEKAKRADGESIVVCAKPKVRIELGFGRFSESAPNVGGMRGVWLDTHDYRGDYSGGCFMSCDLGRIKGSIERNAEKLGLIEYQLRLF